MTEHMKRFSILRLSSSAVLAWMLLSCPPAAAQQPWTWELPPGRYQEMSMFERGQYDKAAELMKAGSFKAAATEFEKFQTQFAGSKFLSHILFMRAYCMHQNKTRGEAVKLYNEVMDFFGQNVDDAAPALYFMGVAKIENGDVKEGLKCMQEMIDDADYSRHPLVAGAYRVLGDNCWRNKERDKAVKYWRLAAEFGQKNQHEAEEARNSATAYYVKTKNYSGYEAWLVNPKNADDVKYRRWVAENAWNIAWKGFEGDWNGEYTVYNQKEKGGAMTAFWTWFKTQRQWYEKSGAPWTFYDRSISFLSSRSGNKEERDGFVEEALAYIRKLEDKADANSKLAWISDKLRDGKVFDRAIYIADQISDRPYAEYKKYEVYGRQNDWEKAVARLKEIEAMPNDKWRMQAMNERARLYREVLGKYDEAIKLYQLINQPPGTLWGIQECYKRWGKLDESLQQLSEIENSFPDQAPLAAWRKAAYLDEAGQRDRAIAQARRIMKVYPKTDASSKAHQLLEKLGVKTGGGVSDGGDGDAN